MGVAIVGTPPSLDAATTANKDTIAHSMVSNQFVPDQLHMPSSVTHDAPKLLESSSRFVKRKRMPTEDPNISRMLAVAKSKKVGIDHRRTTVVIRDTISETLNTEPIVTIGVASQLGNDNPRNSDTLSGSIDTGCGQTRQGPRVLANLANSGDGSGVQSLQNLSTASVFLHTEDFNRANPSSSNHCKRTHADIQAILPTCDMGIAWNVLRRDVTDGITSTSRGVGYAYAVTRNSEEGSSFVPNEGRNHRRLGCYCFHYIFLQKRCPSAQTLQILRWL
nr:hypothetical protein [Tanacetum cinerariifolium]